LGFPDYSAYFTSSLGLRAASCVLRVNPAVAFRLAEAGYESVRLEIIGAPIIFQIGALFQ
jgi:hypothetical protein